MEIILGGPVLIGCDLQRVLGSETEEVRSFLCLPVCFCPLLCLSVLMSLRGGSASKEPQVAFLSSQWFLGNGKEEDGPSVLQLQGSGFCQQPVS